jgi:type IV secretory pathway VirB2 component (pilin)
MKTTRTLALAQNSLFGFLAFALCVMTVSAAFASPMNTPMGWVLCQIVWMVYGNLGRALATIAVIVIGVGATLGKVSWGLAITVAVGIAVIFNAHLIVLALTGVAVNC